MGVVFRSLIFGSVDSQDYDIYISGDEVYNAPERAVEMVSVPGRNGDIVMDMGHWNNIEVSYPCGCFADDQASFRQKIQNFRNAIVSQLGYQRLQDTYHPDEYRLGLYASGLEVEPAEQKAGEFTLTFNCKPQRYLTSGENPQIIADGDTLMNPTQYDAQPLLAIIGNGALSFNGYEISVEDVRMGRFEAKDELRSGGDGSGNIAEFNDLSAIVNTGDSMSVLFTAVFRLRYITNADITSINVTTPPTDGTLTTAIDNYGNATITYTRQNPAEYGYGVRSSVTDTFVLRVRWKNGSTDMGYENLTYNVNLEELLLMNRARLYLGRGLVPTSASDSFLMAFSDDRFLTLDSCIIDSTVSILGNPTYIDCESGDAYKVENDTYYSLNNYIILGADLPTIAPGANTFTKDSTISELKVIPRWWRL